MSSELYAELRRWQREARRLKEEIKKLKQRIKDVEKIRKNLESAAERGSGGVNQKIRSTREDLLNGIDCAGKRSRLERIFSGKEERGLGSDGSLSQADGALQRELNDTRRKLSDAEGALRRAEDRIRQIEWEIAHED